MIFKLPPAKRRMLARTAPALVAYFIVLVAVHMWFGGAARPTGLLVYLAALAPGALILFIFWAVGRYLIEETDEYVKSRLVDSMLWALGVTLAASTVWGFLETFANLYRPPALYVVIVFCGAFSAIQFGRKIADRR